MAISAILTLSYNNSLGDGSTMGWTCADDKKWFKDVTMKIGVVVMGRKTWDTFSNRPLKNRINYVITSKPDLIEKQQNLIPITLNNFKNLKLDKFCVIGGYQIYKEFWKDINVIYLSKHKKVAISGEVFLPDLTDGVLFDSCENDYLKKEIWIKHKYKDFMMNVKYSDGAFMNIANEYCNKNSLDKVMPVGVCFVKDDQILCCGANGSNYHLDYGCQRVKLKIPTGTGYELCEGCNPKNHAEANAVYNAKQIGIYDNLIDSSAYMYGHWWACKDCCEVMRNAGIVEYIMSKNWTSSYFDIVDL